MSSENDIHTTTMDSISTNTTDNEIPATIVPRKKGRPPKAPTISNDSDISSVEQKRKVGRPKKDKNAKEASPDTFAENVEVVEEETVPVREIVEKKKKTVKHRSRDVPIKSKWIEIVGK